MNFWRDGARASAEAALVVVAVGWVADTDGLSLGTAGVENNSRGFIKVDECLRDLCAPYLCCRGHHRSLDVGPASATGRIRCGY